MTAQRIGAEATEKEEKEEEERAKMHAVIVPTRAMRRRTFAYHIDDRFTGEPPDAMAMLSSIRI